MRVCGLGLNGILSRHGLVIACSANDIAYRNSVLPHPACTDMSMRVGLRWLLNGHYFFIEGLPREILESIGGFCGIYMISGVHIDGRCLFKDFEVCCGRLRNVVCEQSRALTNEQHL
jgi:hypothetical protein